MNTTGDTLITRSDATADAPPMVAPPTDVKVAAVQRLYEAYARGDVAGALVDVADHVDWAAEASSTSVPWYGSFRGAAEVPRFFAAIGANVEVTEFVPLGFTANETDVVATIRWAYTVRANGRRATMLMQHWWRFADGRIVSFRGSEDTEQSARAFA